MRTSHRRTAAAFAVLTAATISAGCHNPSPTFGSTPAAAGRNAEGFIGALAKRFGPIKRSEHLSHIRPRLLREALNPSAIYDDEAMWTSASGTMKTLTVTGRPQGQEFLLVTHSDAPSPRRTGESRHTMRLRRLGEDTFAWTSRDELAIGPIGADGAALMLVRALASIERRSENELRVGYSLVLPRTTEAFSRLFSLDSLRPVPLGDGSTLTTFSVRLQPGRARREFPKLAAYLERYLSPARYDIELTDAAGGRWLEAKARDEMLTLRLRTRDGILLPLDGAARELPDTLQMRVALSMKVLLFRVGLSDLVGDFAFVRSTQERGWEVRFREEPKWHFPLAANQIMRGALRRPFDDEGLVLRLTAANGQGGQTLLRREIDATIQESAIVRWLNSLGTTLMDEYTNGVEAEEGRFVGESLTALQNEVASLIYNELAVSLGR